ncbi:MAG: phosphoglucosamine mutase [Armatimonadota bacterium]|nr:phosphoglucosamine mutase [Armatimonadota bacterium]MDR7422550.1 phosphoglucosamine mutase [Armatimonadota bacterium]MDR7454219.1 phosphoglucosamine mutase [Armatimonadota bacterium]MDR7457330.1 phosphoglucosamine mutase [Armatimonadota bacterium]MDR7497305.1 phosphoglucosamine mutase [Armatimonadota bacterium]
MGRYFGTDGIRGVANVDLTPELAFRVGRAAAAAVGGGVFFVGRDTRLSGPMLEAALAAGVCSTGASVELGGILPTPAVAYLARRRGAACGVVISASHNPVEDNGIKLFGPDGYKLPDAREEQIEALLDGDGLPRPSGAGVGDIRPVPDAEEAYLAHVASLAVGRLDGLRVVVDCAYGAAVRTAPRLWRALGAEVIALHAEPDGARINVGCGSTHLAPLQAAVRASGADLGLAHDGDADRVLAVDEHGEVADGDTIMGICALDRRGRGVAGDVVVATVMSNAGFETALRAAGVRVERTGVGDRYVLERMREIGATLGGEQSGHIIFLDATTTGDGLVTAVELVNVMRRTGRPLSALRAAIPRFPQVLRNVRVGDRNGVAEAPVVREAVAEAMARLAGAGRILVRPSGTEPLVRVMVEAPSLEEAEAVAGRVAEAVARAAGGAA